MEMFEKNLSKKNFTKSTDLDVKVTVIFQLEISYGKTIQFYLKLLICVFYFVQEFEKKYDWKWENSNVAEIYRLNQENTI